MREAAAADPAAGRARALRGTRPVRIAAAALLALIAAVPATLLADAPLPSAQVVLTDAWDMPVALNMVPAGEPALLLVCDPSEVKCREGAVLFDSQATRIRATGVRPACILVGPAEAAREAAVRMGLSIPVYIDGARAVPARLLGQDVMPALILLDGDGRVEKVAVGGGEALDANITAMLRRPSGAWKMLVLIPLVALGIILLVVD